MRTVRTQTESAPLRKTGFSVAHKKHSATPTKLRQPPMRFGAVTGTPKPIRKRPQEVTMSMSSYSESESLIRDYDSVSTIIKPKRVLENRSALFSELRALDHRKDMLVLRYFFRVWCSRFSGVIPEYPSIEQAEEVVEEEERTECVDLETQSSFVGLDCDEKFRESLSIFRKFRDKLNDLPDSASESATEVFQDLDISELRIPSDDDQVHFCFDDDTRTPLRDVNEGEELVRDVVRQLSILEDFNNRFKI